MKNISDRNARQGLGANPERTRQHNNKLVLDALRDARGRDETAGRAEIARLSGLSTQAVSNIIASLEDTGMIRACGKRAAGRGQPAMQYEIAPEGGFALGFEVRPDALFCTVLNLHGQTVHRDRNPLTEATPDHVAREMLRMMADALAELNLPADKLLGAGVVMPGPFGSTGIANLQSDLPGWRDVEMPEWAENLLGLPCIVENDANAAAMAERISGVTQNMDTYACLYFGAGLGLGVVSERQPLRGACGNAGEIGHITIALPEGPVRLEQALSRLSVRDYLQENGVQAETTGELEAHFREECPALLTWIERARLALKEAVHVIENLFDPECIVLCGAMPEAILHALIQDVPLKNQSVSTRLDRAAPRLLTGSSGPMTAARGSAALVLNDAFDPRIPSRLSG